MRKTLTAETHIERFERVPYGFIRMDQNGTIIDGNSRAAEILSEPIHRITGTTYTDLLPEIPFMKKYIESGNFLESPTEINLRDMHISCIPLFIDAHSCLNTLLIPIDQNAQGGFSLNNHSFQKVLDSSLDEIFITDGDGNILFINAAAEALYGETPEKMVGRNVLDLEGEGYFSPSLFPIVKERKDKVSMVQRTKMGKTHHVIAYPSFDEQKELTSVVFNARDITEIRLLREKVERSEVLIDLYKSELDHLQEFHEDKSSFAAFSPNMLKIKRMIHKIAPFDTTVLITGESGVGKGVIAHDIHIQSPRKDREMVHVNCGAIPESLIESELFGYASGAFTGAKKEGQAGLIEQADGGSLFLDEIGEMPLHLQVKLLKFLQEKQIRRLGGSKSIQVDIRIIAATNQDLGKLVAEGKFREDLYYRLNVIPIHIPPLRKRPEDISYMVDYYIKTFNEKYGLDTHLSLEAENLLLRYEWPGNVRELENLMERLTVTAEKREIKASDLPLDILNANHGDNAILVKNIVPLKQAQEQMEEQLIRKAYEIDSSSYKIASLLGINQSTAHRKINQYLKGHTDKQ